MTDSTFRVADLAGAGDALRAGGERVPTWITKEAGNRRLPFDAEAPAAQHRRRACRVPAAGCERLPPRGAGDGRAQASIAPMTWSIC
jgi:hypothetical protein